jgi:hypothetical protein
MIDRTQSYCVQVLKEQPPRQELWVILSQLTGYYPQLCYSVLRQLRGTLGSIGDVETK